MPRPKEEHPLDQTCAQIDKWFAYHPPKGDQLEAYEQLRAAGWQLARAIAKLCPPTPDRSAAIRKVREAVWTANSSIACDGM